jgi:hypothetical protein
VVLLAGVLVAVIVVVELVVLMVLMRRSSRRVHIRWIKDNAIYDTVCIWKLPTINTRGQVSSPKLIGRTVNLFPEDSLPVGDVCDDAASGNVQGKYLGKDLIVCPLRG